MKKTAALILALIFLLAFTACTEPSPTPLSELSQALSALQSSTNMRINASILSHPIYEDDSERTHTIVISLDGTKLSVTYVGLLLADAPIGQGNTMKLDNMSSSEPKGIKYYISQEDGKFYAYYINTLYLKWFKHELTDYTKLLDFSLLKAEYFIKEGEYEVLQAHKLAEVTGMYQVNSLGHVHDSTTMVYLKIKVVDHTVTEIIFKNSYMMDDYKIDKTITLTFSDYGNVTVTLPEATSPTV